MSAYAARGVQSYRQTEVQSLTPLEQVVMLYDGALRFTAVARDAIVRGHVPQRAEAMSRAMAIVSELQSTLDMKAGGEIAAELDRLYTFVNTSLFDASFKQDVKPLDEATKVLRTLREGWSGISAMQKQAAVR